MRKALLVVIVLAAGVIAAYWLEHLGGRVDIQVGATSITTSFGIALLILLAAIAALLVIFAIIGALLRWPERERWKRTARRRAEGDAAVTRALLALASGTGDVARVEVRRARAALGDTPQTLLLAAEAERLAGRNGQAEEAFKALAARPEARFLGLRGLMRAAMERGDWDEALRIAREAEAVNPGAAWLREERAQLALRTRDWREALALAPAGSGRAPLALAAAEQETTAAAATLLEKQAFEADPGFAPGALAYAARLKAAGNDRQARSVLEDAWSRAPNAALAVPYLAGEADPLMRVKAAETLIRRNPGHPESRILLARTAIDAGLTGRARNALDSLMRDGKADRRVYLMLSELEEAEHGNTPDARAAQARWLREAATATPEPGWRCAHCGTAHEQWKPACHVCDTVGEIGWALPGASAKVAPAQVSAPRVTGAQVPATAPGVG
jgi:HemY protein